jgi:hypothetical protein
MARSLEPFDFAGEDDEDAATVLMSGHQRHLLREVLKTPAPLAARLVDSQPEAELAPVKTASPRAAEVVEEEVEGPRWGITIVSVLVAGTALGAAIWKFTQG